MVICGFAFAFYNKRKSFNLRNFLIYDPAIYVCLSSQLCTMESDSPKYTIDDQMSKKSNHQIPLLDLKGVE